MVKHTEIALASFGNWSVPRLMRVSIAVLLILVAGLFLRVPAAAAQPSDWIEYVDAQRGFSLRYPPQWATVNVGALAAFMVAEPERPGQFRRNVVVANIEAVPEGSTPDQVQDNIDEVARTAFGGYTVLKREPIDVGTASGIMAHTTWTPAPGVRVYQIRIVLIVNGRAHDLIGTTLADSPTLDADLVLLLSVVTTYRVIPLP